MNKAALSLFAVAGAAAVTALLPGADAPSVSTGSPDATHCFYRAVKATGLYHIMVVRTISLTFTQSNWLTLLANGRTTGSNTLATLVLDNSATNYGVGVRDRGNTSFTGMGPSGTPAKKSLNLEIDYTNAASRLRGYKTLNLNNAYMDESLMREPLYFNVMRQYTVCPHSSFAKLYINGAYWGMWGHGVTSQHSTNRFLAADPGSRGQNGDVDSRMFVEC